MRQFRILLYLSLFLTGCATPQVQNVDLNSNLQKGQAALPAAMKINAVTEFYPNIPLHLRLNTIPERNLTSISARSCNYHSFAFEGLEDITFKDANPPTIKACHPLLKMTTDDDIAVMVPKFKRFQIVDNHLVFFDENQRVLVKAKILADEK